MIFARSGIVAATLLIVQSTFSIAAPLSDNTVHGLEKRISCHTNEIAENNACVSCASLYPNATTCSRSEPLTCSYGVPNSKRKCAAVDCTKTPGTYLSTDAKQCLACNDTHALTCNSTTTLSCQANYTLYPFDNVCYFGKPYSQYIAYGLAKPFSSSQQPFSEAVNGDPVQCLIDHPKARVLAFSGNPYKCYGQNGALDQTVLKKSDGNAFLILASYCVDLAKNPFVTANKAQGDCEQFFVGPDGTVTGVARGP
ncbi:BZ3500_MvSof-1268-A1-R1_Chr8-1g09800 [Microbotryum saponariae]|uniref:BZ3500_MvSof-1268-A1-R1_Chr8-1g09800 protein n=1 Tax=Microbotryum saponariae TaxID=289078 RepID=A0A2X0NPD9_9BASI|nr:BZ3500_MvSof-1268-A1-R1_Chr8-1g09800 [Microbotryum saponariae]SDA08086.1 BZ3501_MvSof-1269-A2-R1_Chr8-1g09523 [Microbotryum saponariae]